MIRSTFPKINFSEDSFSQHYPAQLSQTDWSTDTVFVESLRQSWFAQYSEYLGDSKAHDLLAQLMQTGDILSHDPALTILASIEGQAAGIASLRAFPGFALITMLEVVPHYQHKGIGRQLLQALVNTQTTLVAHVSIHRPWIKQFYEKEGFRTMPRTQVDHYGNLLTFDVMALKQ